MLLLFFVVVVGFFPPRRHYQPRSQLQILPQPGRTASYNLSHPIGTTVLIMSRVLGFSGNNNAQKKDRLRGLLLIHLRLLSFLPHTLQIRITVVSKHSASFQGFDIVPNKDKYNSGFCLRKVEIASNMEK